jgi:uncharacterized protein YggE
MTGMRRLLPILLAAAAALLALALLGVGRPTAARGDTTPSTSSSSVTTVGHGVVTVIPDRATISGGVRTSATTAAEAMAGNAAAATKVIAALKKAGGSNVQTQEVSLYPQMSKGRVTGYVAQNTVSAEASIADAGRLIDAAVAAGANTVDGPSLSVSDQDALYRQALQKALADARAKAQALAQAGSFGLGGVESVTEQSAETPIVYAATPTAGKAPSTPVEPGTQDVTADVQVTFAIR